MKNILSKITAMTVLAFAMITSFAGTANAVTLKSMASNGIGSVTVSSSEEAALRASIVKTAASQNGVKYMFNTANPGVSFDCSGLVAWVYYENSISMMRSSAMMRETVRTVPASQAKAGDLIFSGRTSTGAPTHVGIIADPKAKTYWNATMPGDQVRLSSYAGSWYNTSTYGSVITTTPGAVSPATTMPTNTFSASASSSAKTKTTTTKAIAPVKRRVVSGVNLNVRSAATTNSTKVGSLKGGTTVTGVITNGWMKITSGTHAGRYISATYLRS